MITSPHNFTALTKILYSFFQDKYQYDITKELSEDAFKDILQQSILQIQKDPETTHLDLEHQNKAVLSVCIRKIKDFNTNVRTPDSNPNPNSDVWSEQLAQLEQARKLVFHPEFQQLTTTTTTRSKRTTASANIPMQQTFVSMTMPQHVTKSKVVVIESHTRPFHQWNSRSCMTWNGDAQLMDLTSYVSIRISKLIFNGDHARCLPHYIRLHVRGPMGGIHECILVPSATTTTAGDSTAAAFVPISEAAGYMPLPPLPWTLELKDPWRHDLTLGQDGVRIVGHQPQLPPGTAGEWKTEFTIISCPVATGHRISILTKDDEEIYATVESVTKHPTQENLDIVTVMAPALTCPSVLLNMSQQWTLFVEFFKDR